MTKNIFIVIPAETPDGPIKGAFALANGLSEFSKVTIVSTKKGVGANSFLVDTVDKICLSDHSSSFLQKVRTYKDILRETAKCSSVVSISMCFSADMLNMLSNVHGVINCSSVRGNLIENYRMEYGLKGVILGSFHLFCLRFFKRVIAMTKAMADQIQVYSGIKPIIIGNFIQESEIDFFRTPPSTESVRRLVFVGSLTKRKNVALLISSVDILISNGLNIKLDIIGSGPEENTLRQLIEKYQLCNEITLLGFKEKPMEVVSGADLFVLPSYSEGISRAAMEALYLGVPCILRESDGNAELIRDGENGALFSTDDELPEKISSFINLRRLRGDSSSMLPEMFRQSNAIKAYLNLLVL